MGAAPSSTGDAAAGRQPSALGSLLRIPVFRRVWAGITFSSLGDWLGLLATTALAAFLTRDASSIAQGAAISGVLVTRLLPDLILGPVAGSLVDRLDRRKVAVICDSLAGLLYLVIAFSPNITVLLVGQFLVEAVGLFSTPAKQAMWVNIVPRERLALANQINYVSIYGMVPVASVLFALLSTTAQFFMPSQEQVTASTTLISGSASRFAVTTALIFNAATFFISAAIIYFSRRQIPAFVGERSTSQSVFSLIREGFRFIKNSRVMRALYLGILGAFGAGGLVAGVAQSYVALLGAGNAGYGILFGAVFTGLALGMLVGPKVFPAMSRRLVFTASIGVAGVMLLLMALIPDFVGAVFTAVAMGLAAGIAWITGFTMIGHEVSDQLRGRVFGFVMSSVRLILLGAIAVGPVLAGALGVHTITIGAFELTLAGPALVLGVGGLLAIAVSLIAGRQAGGLKMSLFARMMRRRRLLAERHDQPGLMIAVEGADDAAVTAMAAAVREHLADDGWDVRAERTEVPAAERDGEARPTVGQALRGMAQLSDRLTSEVDAALDAGAIVVFDRYVDSVIVRFGSLGEPDEDRLVRLGLWVVRGWPDLTIVVDSELSDDDPAALAAPIEAGAAPADPTDPTQVATNAYRERAASAPERYLRVAPLAAAVSGPAALPDDLVERINSVIRVRSPHRLRPEAGQAAGGAGQSGELEPVAEPAAEAVADPASSVRPETPAGSQDGVAHRG